MMIAWLLLLSLQDHAPWSADRHPSDAPKRHVEQVQKSNHSYTVTHGGTMDGTNCRTPISVGMMDGHPIEQTWESNRAVRLENIGETDVINPWLSNGRNLFRTIEEIVASAVAPGMTDREKAYALYYQEIRHRYHWGSGSGEELGNPVKTFNVYGFNTCGNDSMCLAGLWRRAGLKVTPARLVGHCVSQVFFDGRWNLFDGDMHSMYLLRDNQTVAGEQDLVRDHDLIKRSHTQGILNPDSRANDEWESSIYVFEGEPKGDRDCYTSAMNMTLRPNESIVWRWGHATPVKYNAGPKPRYPDTICNGLWEYRPDFTKDLWKKGAVSVEGVRAARGELAAEDGKTGAVVWTVRSPYVIVGGRLEPECSGTKFSISWDGKTWMDAGPDLDRFFLPDAPARYEYRLRAELAGDARLKRLGIVNDLQMAPLALPSMIVGKNAFVYTDQSPARQVRITHEWVERSATKPPDAPDAPSYPPNNGDAEGTDLVFRWTSRDPDGDKIADHQFELSDRQDLRWPLSTNFYRLLSKTADRGKAQYTLSQAGLLSPDRKYYWRVRARDEKGVWGPWSAIWSFTARGPSAPVEVTLAVDADRATGLLRWKPGATGRKPAKYRVYGSDEKGFSVSDEPYKRTVGISKEVPSNAPGNFVIEVTATEAAVLGHAFYRVVAVDDKGKRSGPSDFVESPRPVLYSKPVTAGKVGTEYRYPLAAVRSVGDLRTRSAGGRETMSFWDIESPRFALQQGPAWLKIDEKTGLLSGIPDVPGKVPVAVTATIDREDRKLDPSILMWGSEKVVSTGMQRLGVSVQKFVLEIAP